MSKFHITGGIPLKGEVTVGGAKNAALPLIAAATLSSEPVTITNVPKISDIPTMLEILTPFGVTSHYTDSGNLVVDASNLHMGEPDYAKISEIRASVLKLGPLLARLGQAKFVEPGGCKLGVRSIDTHLKAFEALGATVAFDGEYYDIKADKLVGGDIVLEEISLTGTENALMAASLAQGVTTIHLAAVEPEVINLSEALIAMGAKIEGVGSHTLKVTGVEKLHGATVHVIPDRIEAVTFAVAAAVTGGELTIHGYTTHHLDLVTSKLREAGVQVDILSPDTAKVSVPAKLTATSIRTDIYPGFPTDMQPLFAALMLKAVGRSLVHETMYDSRFRYVAELAKLGAKVELLDPHRLAIEGVSELHGATVSCPDIRGGAGLLLASLSATGATIIENAYPIERGYSDIQAKLTALGGNVTKIAD